MYSNYCDMHGDRLIPQTLYGGDRPKVVMVCPKCKAEAQERSQLEADRDRAAGDY